MKEPKVKIGILSGKEIRFILHTPFYINGKEAKGDQQVLYKQGKVMWQEEVYDELYFEPANRSAGRFELLDVTIGINFHWERKENQQFQGALKIIIENESLTGINIIGIEAYLQSVISSEMSATASLELLKAHAVISRSWLLAQIIKNSDLTKAQTSYSTCVSTEEEITKWYDREDHINYDVCADDHCQRYQGITRECTENAGKAVESTRGQVLCFDNNICDARFSKCCGGAFEEFQYCWENKKHPYLIKQRDSKTSAELPDLRHESEARKWILSSPEAFCNTTDKKILSQVLNNYDQETSNFFRWRVEYTQKELSELIRNRSGIDFGDILDLIPVERGTSGRLTKLKIHGNKQTITIGKELEIRRILSTSHLYSSAFVIEKEEGANNIPNKFRLSGAGWGHGVGLCQIGAAVMGEKGYLYDEILLHYYIGAEINKIYN